MLEFVVVGMGNFLFLSMYLKKGFTCDMKVRFIRSTFVCPVKGKNIQS